MCSNCLSLQNKLEHSKFESEQKIARQRYELKSKLEHCLNEALLLIDRPSPNLDMAISRILMAKEILKNN